MPILEANGYFVTIGAGGDFATYREFLESSDPGFSPRPWTVTFLGNQIHSAQRYYTAFNQGTWMAAASEVLFTSEGFTGIPYGKTGGNTAKLQFNFGDSNKMSFNSSTTCPITWQDIEIDIGADNGTNNSQIAMQSYAYPATFNRVIIVNWKPGGNTTNRIFGVGYSNTGGGFFISNSLITDCQFGTGSGRNIFQIVQTSGNTDGAFTVMNTTIAGNDDSESSGVAIFGAKDGASDTLMKAYNNVIGVENGDAFDTDWNDSVNRFGNVCQSNQGAVPNVNVWSLVGNTSAVYEDVAAGDFTLKAGSPAEGAGFRLSDEPGNALTITIRGNARPTDDVIWDSGATMALGAPVESTSCDIESYLESFGSPGVKETTGSNIESYLESFGIPTVVLPPEQVTAAVTASLRSEGAPSVVIPPSDNYNNPSNLVYTNPAGLEYGPGATVELGSQIYASLSSSGEPSPHEDTNSQVLGQAVSYTHLRAHET